MTSTTSTHLRRRSLLELFVATSIFGLAFVTSIWAMEGIGPIWVTSIRFIFAIVMLDLLSRARVLGLEPLKYSWQQLKAVFWPGFFLFGTLTFQTWGLKYTSATKCGFITVLYVLLVPFLERIFFKRKISPFVWLWIGLALVGTALICGAIVEVAAGPGSTGGSIGFAEDFLGAFNIGDGLTLLCAFAAAGHLIVLNHKLQHSEHAALFTAKPVLFHIYQSVWVIILAAVLGYFVEGTGWTVLLTGGFWTAKIWLSVLQLGLMSSGIAFLILVRAQRYVPATTAGLVVLLESPWAMVFSVWLMDEKLTLLQLLGAGLILTASVAECIQQAKK